MGIIYSIYQNDKYINVDKNRILDLYKNNELLNNNSNEYNDYNLGLYSELINSYDIAREKYISAFNAGNKHAIQRLYIIEKNLKNYDEATIYNLMITGYSHSDSIIKLGKEYMFKKDYEKANKYFIKAIDMNNNSGLICMAYLYFELKNYDQSELYLKMACDTGDTYAINIMAKLLYFKKKYEEATKYLLLAIEKENYNEINLIIELNIVKIDNKIFEKATKYFLNRIEKEDLDAMANMGILEYKIFNNIDEAKKYNGMAIKKNHYGALCNMINILITTEDYSDAKKYLEILINIYKEPLYLIDAYNVLGYIFFREKNYKEATKYYKMCIDNGHEESICCISSCLIKQKKYEEAEKYCKLGIVKGFMKSLNNMGVILYNLKRYDEAKIYYNMIIEKEDSIDKNSNSVAIALYNIGVIFDEVEKDYKNAKKYYIKSIKMGYIEAEEKLKNITTNQERYELYKENNITITDICSNIYDEKQNICEKFS
jgi:tetratricopeptide (TPR) repeat protein